MEKTFKVTIYTPYGLYLNTEADFLSTTSAVGVIGILPNHAPLISTLEISKLVIRRGSDEKLYASGGGVINIKKDHSVTLLLESIERQDEINLERALASKKRAEERLSEKTDEIDVKRAKASLLRALNRINVSDKN